MVFRKEPHSPHPDSWETAPFTSWMTGEEMFTLAQEINREERVITAEVGPRPTGSQQQ
jgi:hypothetical protein